MTKAVQLSPTAHEWLRRHQFLSEEVILSVVLHCPTNERKYTDSNHFQIDFRRRKDGGFVKITIWVHDRATEYYVGKMHSQRT
jgi:hypothetical protein